MKDFTLRGSALLAVATLSLAGCRSGTPPSVEGLWMSQGYGFLVEAADGQIKVREVTAVSCIARDEALSRVAVEADGSWRLQVGDDPSGAFFGLESESVARLKRTGTASDILFGRVAEAPGVCDEPVEATPQATFDVFWTTYREHYPFFAMKGVDWDSVRNAIRPRVTADMSSDALFGILSEAIAPLEDAHTNIVGEGVGPAMFMRPDPELAGIASALEAFGLVEPRFARAVEIIESRYLNGELQHFCNGHLRYGMLPGNLAYVYLDQEGGYTDEPDFESSLAVLEAALDTIFTAAQGASGLILDVRKNYGGSDIFSLAVASRLATTDYRAYAKVARSDPDDPTRFTPEQPRTVPTTARPSFAGPVVELTGRYTISAGETLTQALMGREPHITRIGEHTQGVFSDVLGRELPNGWQFGLPNELFLTEDGNSFDGPGIPPDIAVPVFRKADLDAGRDPALERAMAHLGGTGG